MYSTPLDEILTACPPLTDEHRRALLHAPGLSRLAAAFAHVPDFRRRRGRRYTLAYLLTCLVAGLLAGCDSTHAVGQWCGEHRELLARLFPGQRHLTPSGALYRRLLPRLSAEHLEWALAGWVQATRPVEDAEPVALDGKTVRGAGTSEQPAPHLLAIYTHQSQETLVQVRVADKTNEIPVAQALLPLLSWRGRVVTADALHTQVALVAGVVAQGGDVVLTVKANQPTLHADLALAFADPATPLRQAQTVDRRRGRVERRTLRVTTALSAYLASQSRWPHLAQVAQLTRTVTTGTGSAAATTTEVVYVLTTLPPERACPHCLLRFVRQHWQIENGLHWVRDVTFGEDRSRLRTGHAPQILAALRNVALTLIHRTGSRQIAASRRTFAAHPDRAFALLLPAA
jgi:predicted transposase YbfD/YdcC